MFVFVVGLDHRKVLTVDWDENNLTNEKTSLSREVGGDVPKRNLEKGLGNGDNQPINAKRMKGSGDGFEMAELFEDKYW